MCFVGPASVRASGIRCFTAFLVSLLLLSVDSAELRGSTLRETGVRQQRDDAQGHIGDEGSLVLDVNQPIKRKIGGGENHYYRIMLMSDEYLRLIVDQRGIDVSVSLYAPDGSIVAESNRFIGQYGPETISWVAENPGFYKLQIRSDGRENNAEYYEVQILEERVATFQDRRRITPQSIFVKAEQLRKQNTPQSLDKAIAKYEESLQMWRLVADRSGEAETLNVMGLVYHLLKRDAVTAREHYYKALQVWRSIGGRRGEAESLNNIARVYESLGERQRALDYYGQSLEPWRDLGDRYGEAWTLYNMGRVSYLMRVAQQAIHHYSRALRLWRDLKDLSREAATLNSIGEAYAISNDYKNALINFEQARERWQAIGDLNGEVSTLFSISKTYSVLHEQQREREFRTLAEQLKARIQRAVSALPKEDARWNKSRNAEQAQEQARQLLSQGTEEAQRSAIVKHEEARRIFDSIGDYDHELSTLFDISSIYRVLSEKENERKTLDRALSLAKRIGRFSLRAEALQRLGDFYLFLGDRRKR